MIEKTPQTTQTPESEHSPTDMHVFMSHASIGGMRRVVSAGEAPSPRTITAGNMSEEYAQLDAPDIAKPKEGSDIHVAERAGRANENINEFVESVGYEPRNVVILRPTNPRTGQELLGIKNADEVFTPGQSGDKATWLPEDQAGDFIYTRNPDVVLGCRPADCPVLVFKGLDGDGKAIEAMLHAGWQNLNAGHLEQALAFLQSQGVTKDTLHIAVGAGAYKDNFPYKNAIKPGDEGSRFNHPDYDKLAVDIRFNEQDDKYHWNIDMFGFVDAQLEKYGIDPTHVIHNGSDTARMDSGYSSNARAKRGGTREVETRDLVLASLGEPSQAIMLARQRRIDPVRRELVQRIEDLREAEELEAVQTLGGALSAREHNFTRDQGEQRIRSEEHQQRQGEWKAAVQALRDYDARGPHSRQ